MNIAIATLQSELPGQYLGRLEDHLHQCLPSENATPRYLHQAMRCAVFPGGKRIRPLLLLLVATSYTREPDVLDLALRAACAFELVHCASLVHDDLPAFDNAVQRRGQPSVHIRFGEPLAILAGDALLTLAFEIMTTVPQHLASRALSIARLLGRATGSLEGIIGGQSLEELAPLSFVGALECLGQREAVERYHAMKSAALFRMAAEAGAVAAGDTAEAAAWGEIGYDLGLYYQLLDDLYDAFGRPEVDGKPVQQDAKLGRPNAVAAGGVPAVQARLQSLRQAIRHNISTLATVPTALLALLDGLGKPRMHDEQSAIQGISAA